MMNWRIVVGITGVLSISVHFWSRLVVIIVVKIICSCHQVLEFLDILDTVSDDVNFGHSLGLGSCWDMRLEMLIAVIDRLDTCPLTCVSP